MLILHPLLLIFHGMQQIQYLQLVMSMLYQHLIQRLRRRVQLQHLVLQVLLDYYLTQHIIFSLEQIVDLHNLVHGQDLLHLLRLVPQ